MKKIWLYSLLSFESLLVYMIIYYIDSTSMINFEELYYVIQTMLSYTSAITFIICTRLLIKEVSRQTKAENKANESV